MMMKLSDTMKGQHGAGHDSGHQQRQRHQPEALPVAGVEVLCRLVQPMVHAPQPREDRHQRERKAENTI